MLLTTENGVVFSSLSSLLGALGAGCLPEHTAAAASAAAVGATGIALSLFFIVTVGRCRFTLSFRS